MTGGATVYSWVRVHRTSNARFADSVPYVVATIELASGCRMVAQLDAPGPVAIGCAVQPIFVDHEGWTEVRFRPTANGAVDG